MKLSLSKDANMVAAQYKYLYERLDEKTFQQLVEALLSKQFPRFQAMPLGQSDGGRDGISPGMDTLIYQVKFSVAGHEKDPVTWLSSVLKGEESNLRRLHDEGVRKYCLVTNLSGTGKPGTGTIDRMQQVLDSYKNQFDFNVMDCVWRDTVNAWVDNADDGLKWTYADMLAGIDSIRYLSNVKTSGEKNRLKDLIRQIVSYEWEKDGKMKFSQVQMIDRKSLAKLFIDVTATRLSVPREIHVREPNIAGVAKYLLNSESYRYILVKGIPGQGKSTLGQYICQAHRARFLPDAEFASTSDIDDPLFPVRLDLSEYASWLDGSDIGDYTEGKDSKTKRRAVESSLECYLAELFSVESGTPNVSADEVQSILKQLPSLLVLDGLDEVGDIAMRKTVVKRIEEFASRGKVHQSRVVVTTRPSAGDELAEPSADVFEVITLNPLTPQQQTEYLTNWCRVSGGGEKELDKLRQGFLKKRKEPYIGNLASNPMQLTILLELLYTQGDATPNQRTELYDKYVDLLLARESNKNPDVVKKHRDSLLEIIPFLGWYLQSHAEESSNDERMSVEDIKVAMHHFEHAYGNPETVVDELFRGATDRLWVLTSKRAGTFEFEILSLREYFAARYLYAYAGEVDPKVDKIVVLRELMRRPFWLNTARFYGGNAKGGDFRILKEGIKQEMQGNPPASSIIAAWMLLADGIFQSKPLMAREIIQAICSSSNSSVLLNAFEMREITPIPDLPRVSAENGPDPTWEHLTKQIEVEPASENSIQSARILQNLLSQAGVFAEWWLSKFTDAQSVKERLQWLRLGVHCHARKGLIFKFDEEWLYQGEVFDEEWQYQGEVAELILNSGVIPEKDSLLEKDLIESVLAGECLNVSNLDSLPAQIAAALNPTTFMARKPEQFADLEALSSGHRYDAVRMLSKSHSQFAKIVKERKVRRGQKDGTTYPWANVAGALYKKVGRCFLATEIAVIGVMSGYRIGVSWYEGTTAFGVNSHPETLLMQLSRNKKNLEWWTDQLNIVREDDQLSQADWLLSSWCVADPAVRDSLWASWASLFAGISTRMQYALTQMVKLLVEKSWVDELWDLDSTGKPVRAEATQNGKTRKRERVGSSSGGSSRRRRSARRSQKSLLAVARKGHWLKVDEVPRYR